MNREDRLGWLLSVLARTGRIDVEAIAREGNVSAATIRRDLDHLESQQLLTRTHGGAVANSVAYDLPLRYKSARNASEKQRIGAAAAQLLGRAKVVGLNGGTTTTEVARALAAEAAGDGRASKQRTITVVTNAVNIAGELAVRPNVKIVLTGGVARAQTYELVGPLSRLVLAELSLDIAFIGVDGVDESGASAHDEDEADINRLMACRARRVVVVADSSKLQHRSFAHICDLDRIDVLITDSGAEPAVAEAFTAHGVEVVRA